MDQQPMILLILLLLMEVFILLDSVITVVEIIKQHIKLIHLYVHIHLDI